MERTIPRFDREATEGYVCELLGDRPRTMRIDIHELERFTACQTHNKGGNHGTKSTLRVAVITNQCVNCGSIFADRSNAQNHGVNSWSRGTCRTDRSHMPWPLEEVTQPISCNLREREFWGSAKGLRACPLDAPALPSSNDQRESTCLASSTAKTQQATRKKWTRARACGPSRGTAAWSQRSSKTEGSSDEPPAEPSEIEAPAARRQWWPIPKQTSRSSRRASTKSCPGPILRGVAAQ